MLDPSYAMFLVYAEMFGAESVLVPYSKDMVLDTEFLLNSIVPGVKYFHAGQPQPTYWAKTSFGR